MMVFTVPSAVLLSITFMKVKYQSLHYISSALSILAVIAVVICDTLFYDDKSGHSVLQIILGDLICLLGVFLLASSNVYEEWLMIKGYKMHEIFAFAAPTGFLFALAESFILGEFRIVSAMDSEDILP